MPPSSFPYPAWDAPSFLGENSFGFLVERETQEKRDFPYPARSRRRGNEKVERETEKNLFWRGKERKRKKIIFSAGTQSRQPCGGESEASGLFLEKLSFSKHFSRVKFVGPPLGKEKRA